MLSHNHLQAGERGAMLRELDQKEVGRRVRRLRRLLELTQKDLASKVPGADMNTISRLEGGKSQTLNPKRLNDVARAAAEAGSFERDRVLAYLLGQINLSELGGPNGMWKPLAA